MCQVGELLEASQVGELLEVQVLQTLFLDL